MRSLPKLLAVLAILAASPVRADDFLPGAKRIVFLGDSITHSGLYVDYFLAYVFTRHPDRQLEVIDIGLSSETVSGLSEEGHAGGKFPRPDLHERLDRALEKTRPDLVFACYGMNDGIYLPFSEERFAKFREGMEKLHSKVEATGAKIIHITPPTFDPPGGDTNDYNGVLDKYSEWLVGQRAKGWRVIDLHSTMNKILLARRAADPDFRFAKDGVHPGEAGHWVIAMELVGDLEGANRAQAMAILNKMREPGFEPAFFKLIHQYQRALGDAWLADIGHKRPGVAKGLPLDEAKAKAAELEKQIHEEAARVRTKVMEAPGAPRA